VPAQLYRAALEGTAPSTALLKTILDQLHSRLVRDEHYNLLFDESRFALLKLILNRNRKHNTMEIKPRLTADTDDPAYNCGRLLAVLAAAQDKAHDYKLEGAGVAERYFGTASISPASVFPLLLRLNRHHLNKISKSERFAGHERFLQEQIQMILTLFKPEQPGEPPVFFPARSISRPKAGLPWASTSKPPKTTRLAKPPSRTNLKTHASDRNLHNPKHEHEHKHPHQPPRLPPPI
jgi:CRISPR-associated protein Csd1